MKANWLISSLFLVFLGWLLHWNASYLTPKPLTLEGKIELLEKTLAEKDHEIEILNKQLGFLKKNEDEIKKTISELSQKETNLTSELKKSLFEKEQLSNSFKIQETQISNLIIREKELDEKNKELTNKNQELAILNKEIKELTSKNQELTILNKEINNKNKEVKVVSPSKELENKIKALEKEIAELKIKDFNFIIRDPFFTQLPPTVKEEVKLPTPLPPITKEEVKIPTPLPPITKEEVKIPTPLPLPAIDPLPPKKDSLITKLVQKWDNLWKTPILDPKGPPENWAEIYKKNLKVAENKKYPENCLSILNKVSKHDFSNSAFELEENQKEWIKRWFFNSLEGSLYFQLTIYKEIPPHLDNAHSFDFLVFADDKHVLQFTGTWEDLKNPHWRDLDVIGYLPGRWESWLSEISK